MATFKPLYGTNGVGITITLASLAAATARQSASIDNRTNLYQDVLVMLKVVFQAGTPGDLQSVNVYGYGTVDDGTTWPDAVTGSDAAITLNSPTQLKQLGVIPAPTSAGTFIGGPWSVAACFGNNMPALWGIVVENRANMTFSATEGNHKKIYQGLQIQGV